MVMKSEHSEVIDQVALIFYRFKLRNKIMPLLHMASNHQSCYFPCVWT